MALFLLKTVPELSLIATSYKFTPSTPQAAKVKITRSNIKYFLKYSNANKINIKFWIDTENRKKTERHESNITEILGEIFD